VQRSLFDVQNLIGREFDPADRFRLFHEKVYPSLLAVRRELAACYCADNGRPAEEPVMLLGATILQFMERAPDRAAAECVGYHLGWKLALGLDLSPGSFHPTTLCVFRQRLLEHEKAKLAFDAVLSGLVEAGLVSRRSRQRLDSTHVLGLVAKMSSLDVVRETLRLALMELDQTLSAQEQSGLQPPPEMNVDAGYISAEALREAAEQGRELVGPALPPGGDKPIRSDAFDVDVPNRRAVCPAGHASTNCSCLKDKDTACAAHAVAGCPRCACRIT
jgi:hypothetical protein